MIVNFYRCYSIDFIYYSSLACPVARQELCESQERQLMPIRNTFALQ